MKQVRWQQTPRGMVAAKVGPDGRTWLQRGWLPDEPSADDLRRALEHEFRRPQPVIAHARLARFEPGGRVWFYFNRQLNTHYQPPSVPGSAPSSPRRSDRGAASR